jgi:hypothetical protein
MHNGGNDLPNEHEFHSHLVAKSRIAVPRSLELGLIHWAAEFSHKPLHQEDLLCSFSPVSSGWQFAPLQIAAVRTSRRRRCQFLAQRTVPFSLCNLMLSFAVEARFVSINC